MSMIEEVWNRLSIKGRLEFARRAGWKTFLGRPDKTAKRLSKCTWKELTPAAQRVLFNKAIEAQLAQIVREL